MSATPETEAIYSANATVTATLVSAPGRLRAIFSRAPLGSGGTLTLRDGGSGGTVIATYKLPAGGRHTVRIPGGGMPFGTDLHATLTSVNNITAFYARD